ncbi:hypothetical protein WG906_02515 [Pedobacter sp. P351]|uniref:hypothetical protein n=1 Tax=Pedobacter superstes TaxID=3133441 RepID=UPI003095362A
MSLAINAYTQTEPALPSPCLNAGPASKNYITVTGTTTFTFNTLSDFSSSESLNNITIYLQSTAKYKLYIAGVMTGLSSSSTNTPIPINTFTVSSTNRGTSPATVTLSNSYVEVAQLGIPTNGINHVLTITRNALSGFVQAPGTHTLTLHIRFCQY